MNPKTTFAMFGVIGVLAVGALAAVLLTGNKAADGDALLAGLTRAGVTAKQIDTLEIETRGENAGKLVFARKAGRWGLVEPRVARVDGALVEDALGDLLRARPEAAAELSSNPATLGLDKPAVTVTLKKGVETNVGVHLGAITVGGSEGLVYVNTTDDPTPRAVKRSSIDSLLKRFPAGTEPKGGDPAVFVKALADFRPLRLLDLGGSPADEASAVSLKVGATELALAKADGKWAFKTPAGLGDAEVEGTGPSVDQSVTGVRPLLSSLNGLTVPAGTDYNDSPKALVEYGLAPESPDRLVVTVTHTPSPGFGAGEEKPAERTEIVYLGKPVPEQADRVYARVEGDNSVTVVQGGPAIAALRRVASAPNAIRDKTLVRVQKPAVDALSVAHGPNTLDLVRSGEPPLWRAWEGADRSESVTPTSVDALVNALTQERAIRDFPAAGKSDADLGFDKPSAEVKIWQAGVQPEPKPAEPAKPADGKEAPKEAPKPPAPGRPKLAAEPTVRVLFGKAEGDFVYVRRTVSATKASVDAMIPAAILNLARRDRVDYLDPKLNTFDPSQVQSLVIEGKAFDGRAVKTEVSTDAKEAKAPGELAWKLSQQGGPAGRSADARKVANLLTSLAEIAPIRLIQDRPTPEALAGYGLAPGASQLTAKVILRTDAGGKERVYRFGGVAKEAGQVYALQQGRDLVFAAQKFLFDGLVDSVLMDMTLYSVEPAKVKSLTLRGWSDLVGSVQTREFERTGDVWTLKGGGYAIDPKKVDTFLLDVTRPVAEAFTAFGTGATAEQGLDLEKGAFQVELKGDGFEPVTLTLGRAETSAPPAGGNPLPVYAGVTSRLKGDVFQVSQDRYKAARERPKVFAKE